VPVAEVELAEGDVLTIGEHRFRFRHTSGAVRDRHGRRVVPATPKDFRWAPGRCGGPGAID
jgi:hypothetical protein